MLGLALIASALGAAGVGLLYTSWKRRPSYRGLLIGAGWALLAASIYIWTRAFGAEFGISFALLAIAAFAWIAVAANAEVRQRRERTRASADKAPAADEADEGGRGIWGHLALFLLSVPVAAASSAFVCISLTRLLPWSVADRMALAVLVIPLVWGCAAYWVTADSKLVRPALALVAGGLIGAATIYA